MSTEKIYIILSLVLISFINSYSYGLRLFYPKQEQGGDYKVLHSETSGSISYLNVIEMINKYLWYTVGFLCFLFMIYNGYLLIMNRGDDKVTSKATKALIGSFVGVIVCILAYALVKLTVGLFLN